jgi:hypothetical protein
MVQFGDDTYGEERAVKKLFRCVPEKYKQMARSIKSLLDLSMMSIEEAICRLKVVDTDKPQPLSRPITTSWKLLLTREQWDACHAKVTRRGSLLPSVASRAKTPWPGRGDVSRVMLRLKVVRALP